MELVNENLNMWSCKPCELIYRQLKLLGTALEADEKLSDFESFFDDETGKLFMNEDNPRFEWNKRNYIIYLEADEAEREEITKRYYDDENIIGLLNYLDIIASKMEEFKICEMLSKQKEKYPFESFMLFHMLRDKIGLEEICGSIYNYGVIQGKRMERAKKNRHLGGCNNE